MNTFCCFWSNTLEHNPTVCLWFITDTDSVLCAFGIILQSIRNTSIAPYLLTYLLT